MTLADELRAFLPTVYKKFGPLNARQYAYQALANHIVADKKKFGYVNHILVELRKKRILPWSAVLDSSRKFEPWSVIGSEKPEEYVKDSMQNFVDAWKYFDLPRWHYQEVVPVIFTEKDGLIRYFEMIAQQRAVSIYAQKGQIGKSHFHESIFPWIINLIAAGKIVRILYLGDADDEGYEIPVTMLGTISDFAEEAGGKEAGAEMDQYDFWPRGGHKQVNVGSRLQFVRIALSPKQVEELDLPKDAINPESTIAHKYVDSVSELEALDPALLRQMLTSAIDEHWDTNAEEQRKRKTASLRRAIKPHFKRLTERWPKSYNVK